MTKRMTRRTVLKYIGGGVLGLAGITTLFKRKDILAFLDADQRASQSNQGGSGAAVDTRLYRSSGQQLSLLGFGAMRFPTQVINGEKVIDEELSEKMIDYAYRHGVNYFDTAYMYHKGKSEEFLGRVLKKYPRDSYILADKMPGFELDSPARAKEVFQEQLDRCGVEYFDNYFLHYLNKREDFDRFYLQQGVLDYLKEEKARGRIRNLGFSYHGDVPFFEYLMDNFSWDCTLIQLNYQDWNEETETPEGTRIMGSLYRKAAEKGVPCFVMEPVRGGRLASLPESAEKLLKEREPNRSIASWAIRFAASQPEVVTVLSGMSDLNQVVDNINTLSDFKPLSKTDQMVLQKANGNAVALQAVACTYCRYCMPCPYGVDIPGNFKVYNDWAASLGFLDEDRKPSEKQKAEFLRHYRNSIEKPARADHCIHCRKCLELCPQHIDIPAEMRKIDTIVQDCLNSSGRGKI